MLSVECGVLNVECVLYVCLCLCVCVCVSMSVSHRKCQCQQDGLGSVYESNVEVEMFLFL